MDVTLLSGKTVRKLEADACARCGKRYYNLDAVRQVQKAWANRPSRCSPGRPTISTCPTCGSKQIRRKPVYAPVPGNRKVRVQAAVCPDCGEPLFGLEAIRRLEAADPRFRRKGPRGRARP